VRSLRRALLAYILGGVSVVLIVSGVAVFLVARSNLRAQHDEALLSRARTLGSLVVEEHGVLEFEYEGPLGETDIGVLVRIRADDGTIVAQSPGWPRDYESSPPTLQSGPILADVRSGPDGWARAAAVARRAAREPAASGGPAPPPSDRLIVVEVIGRTESTRRAEASVLAALVVGGLFAAAGTTVMVWFGIRRGLSPLRRLGSAVDRIDARELTMQAPGPHAEELEPIVSALKGLLDRLRSAMERERRFTDAAAHELRTPIAELRTITDVADRWPEPQRLHRSIGDARAVVSQMEDLLESLLAAARGESACEERPIESVAILPLARTLSGDAVERTRPRRVSWTFEGDEGACWTGPRAAIAAIVRNLIDNAADYTPDGGTVRVAATTNGQGGGLEVENGPVSLEPQDVHRIFEPFWRADAARSDRRHRGLGLSIVMSLAEALRLRRDLELTPEGRLRIRFTSQR
jgi:two-component system sensor histidine kinase QseC